jgi:hypothetical protein
MLYQLSYSRNLLWAEMDLNHRRLTSADLQSAAFNHSAIDPKFIRAIGGIRTPDPLITNQLLWPTELQWLCLYKKALLSIASQFNILLFNKTTIDFIFF